MLTLNWLTISVINSLYLEILLIVHVLCMTVGVEWLDQG